MKTLDVPYSHRNTQIFFEPLAWSKVHCSQWKNFQLTFGVSSQSVPQGMSDFHFSDGLDHKPAAHHSFFPDPSLRFLFIKSKPCIHREKN